MAKFVVTSAATFPLGQRADMLTSNGYVVNGTASSATTSAAWVVTSTPAANAWQFSGGGTLKVAVISSAVTILQTTGAVFTFARFFFFPNAVAPAELSLGVSNDSGVLPANVTSSYTGGGWTVNTVANVSGLKVSVGPSLPTALLTFVVQPVTSGTALGRSVLGFTSLGTGSAFSIGLQAVMFSTTAVPPGACLHESTLVQLATGARVPAHALRSGDVVHVVDDDGASCVPVRVRVFALADTWTPLFEAAPGVLVSENHTVATAVAVSTAAAFVPPPDADDIRVPAGYVAGLARASGMPAAPREVRMPCALVHVCLEAPFRSHMFRVGPEGSVLLSEGYRSDPATLLAQGWREAVPEAVPASAPVRAASVAGGCDGSL
jgi:hypothetical protein